ncbi:hypothetical protein, partial [Xanthomonas phaseoli]
EPKVLEYVNEAFGRLAERNQAACWVTGKVADGNFGGLWFNPLYRSRLCPPARRRRWGISAFS